MTNRQRARRPEDKQARRGAILDAAERLLLRNADHLPSILEVADEAALAKGTLYLYFPSKEELLLAVHERNIDNLLQSLIERLESPRSVTLDQIIALVRERIAAMPLLLPLASRCFGLMAHAISDDTALAFHARLMTRFARAGAGLERHFELLSPGDGVALLRHSYALIIGLWQMFCVKGNVLHSSETGATATGCVASSACTYADDLERALRALCQGGLDAHNAAMLPRDDTSSKSPATSLAPTCG